MIVRYNYLNIFIRKIYIQNYSKSPPILFFNYYHKSIQV